MVRRIVILLLIFFAVQTALAQETPVPPTPMPNVSSVLPDLNRTTQILLSARSDLEILANNTIGAAERPSGWNGTFDTNDPQMALKARLDLELLADQLLGGTRPDAWFGTQPTSAYSTARDIRHDIELLADTVIAPSVRPPNWVGDLPVMRCGRATQALVLLLESRGLYSPISTPGSPTYCADLEAEISVFTEVNLLDGTLATEPTPAPPTEAPDVESANTPVSIVTFGALAYYDRGALELAGAMPQGLIVTPVARSYAQFSRMMLIRGEGFEVFVDYQDTTLDQTTFEALGDVNVLDFTPSCTAEWCLPPG